MKKSILVSLSFLLILGFGISVSPTQPADAAGEWYVEPGDSIQEAIDEAIAAGGGTIYFAPGVYEECCLHIGPPEDYGLPPDHVIEKLELIGNGSSLEDLVAWIEGTAVSGSVLEASIYIDSADYPVKVQGLGLFNWSPLYPVPCLAHGYPYREGAFWINNSSPTISDCIISHQGTIRHGAGMEIWWSSPIVSNTVFIFCHGVAWQINARGGAIYNYESSPIIINSMFLYNIAPAGKPGNKSFGGAIYNSNSNPELINCVLYGNRAQPDLDYGPPYPGGGSAIYSEGNSLTTLTNCISWNNLDELLGINLDEYIFVAKDESAFDVSYCDTDILFPGSGNISSDPMFVYAPSWDELEVLWPEIGWNFLLLLDFYLETGSPCIDTGDNLAVPDWVSTDIEGNPRILNGTVDMGAYEFEQQLITATVDIDPNTLNLKSKGKWMTATIGLPAGYNCNDIDIFTIELHCNGSSVEVAWGDVQGTVLMVKFNRQTVNGLLSQTGDVELKISGLVNEIPFEGFDTIRVINKGKK